MQMRMVGALCGVLALGVVAGCVVHTYPSDDTPAQPRRRARAHRKPAHTAATATAHEAEEVDTPTAEALPPQPPQDAPPMSRSKAELLPEGVGTGRPPGFKPGAPAAYWIWQGPRGDWRIRTTTNKLLHNFRGWVEGTSATVSNVHPSRNELRDQVWRVRGGAWAFSFATTGHADGFTFAVRDNGCASFDLALDGGPHPKRIFVGKSEHEPSSSHFVVCPKGKKPEGRGGPEPTQPVVTP